MERTTDKRQRRPTGFHRIVILIALAAIVSLVFRFTPLSPSDVTPSSIKELILSLGFWGPVVFVAIYASRAVILVIPVGVMSLAGGLAYGKWWGTALIMVGAMLGSCLAFLVARHLGRRFIEQFAWRHRGRIGSFDEGTEAHGLRIILTARLSSWWRFWRSLCWLWLRPSTGPSNDDGSGTLISGKDSPHERVRIRPDRPGRRFRRHKLSEPCEEARKEGRSGREEEDRRRLHVVWLRAEQGAHQGRQDRT